MIFDHTDMSPENAKKQFAEIIKLLQSKVSDAYTTSKNREELRARLTAILSCETVTFTDEP